MSYGTDHPAQWRRGAEIVDLVLKGTRPADIPVEQPTKFELVVNLKAAKELGIAVPPRIMIRADDVIEWRCLRSLTKTSFQGRSRGTRSWLRKRRD